MSDKEIENNASNEEASETVETPESVDSTPETAETVVEAVEASAPEESVPKQPLRLLNLKQMFLLKKLVPLRKSQLKLFQQLS